MELATLPDRRAEREPDGPAVGDLRSMLTNAEFAQRVKSAAGHLAELGVGPGDVVAVKLVNCVEFVTLLFATWRLGAALTPVNPSLTAVEVVRQVEDSRARLHVIADDAVAVGDVATIRVSELRIDGPDAVPAAEAGVATLALLIYTSGTTGTPKGVMLDHANLDAMTDMGIEALAMEPRDRCLLILPLFHVNGIVASVLTSLKAGASVIIVDRFNPSTFFEIVERERPTYFSAVPTIFSMLAALPDDIGANASSVRFAVCGAAPAPLELLEGFESRFGFPVVEAYGLSEGTCGTTINPLAGRRKPGSAGLPFPGQELRIVDVDGNVVPVGTNGELLVRGPNVMRGYLRRPDDTAAVLVDGWLHTGDIGNLDADGYLTLVGRSKEMIIRGGENIYPKEIEDVLTSSPSVLEAAVVGVDDERWGEVVVAFVQARRGTVIDLDDLKALCTANLSSYKRPTEIRLIDDMPKNALGKVDKKVLRGRNAAVR